MLAVVRHTARAMADKLAPRTPSWLKASVAARRTARCFSSYRDSRLGESTALSIERGLEARIVFLKFMLIRRLQAWSLKDLHRIPWPDALEIDGQVGFVRKDTKATFRYRRDRHFRNVGGLDPRSSYPVGRRSVVWQAQVRFRALRR